jgi:large subunit ribosomal protein L9
MELILREDVPHLGRRGQVVKVAAGYARNYLIPKRLAYVLTEGVRQQVDTESRAKVARDARERGEADTVAARLRALSVLRFARRASEAGTLFGSVTNADVAQALAGRGCLIDKREIRLEEPIKRVGTHRIPVHIHRDVVVEVVVEVEPEEGEAQS